MTEVKGTGRPVAGYDDGLLRGWGREELHDDLPDEVGTDAMGRRCHVRRSFAGRKTHAAGEPRRHDQSEKVVPPLLGAPPKLHKVHAQVQTRRHNNKHSSTPWASKSMGARLLAPRTAHSPAPRSPWPRFQSPPTPEGSSRLHAQTPDLFCGLRLCLKGSVPYNGLTS